MKDGYAQGPVDISEAQNAAYVTILHDGEQIARKDVLTESGEYYIELYFDGERIASSTVMKVR